jgi:diphthine-ammonia ligase
VSTPAQVVLLANLYPADAAVDELDSHMFQTAGHGVVEAYAQCTGLPLLRRRLSGVSLHLGLTYDVPCPGDEVEDLRAVLVAAKRRVPDLGAVCTGALLSDYQRLRVEAVATSLGLTSLAPLWRLNQLAYMQDVVHSAQMHAILVKVAALGLSPSEHLGQPLEQLLPLLARLHVRHGCHAAGEGGEYETLVLDCAAFTRGRLVLDATAVSHSGGGVGHLRILEWHVKLKPGGGSMPPGEVIAVDDDTGAEHQPAEMQSIMAGGAPAADVDVDAGGGHGSTIAGDEAATVSALAPCALPLSAASIAAATHAALSHLSATLAKLGRGDDTPLSWAHVAFVHLYLPDMAFFAAANGAYVSLVPRTAPPARACVAHSGGAFVAVDAAVLLPRAACGAVSRRVMHVQSISGWAPACIGPYAQAVCVANSLVFLAGQLGLVPTTMTLPTTPTGATSSAEEACWAVRSADAVASAMGAHLRGALAVTLYATSQDAAADARAAWADSMRGVAPPAREYAADAAGVAASDEDGNADAPYSFGSPLQLLVLVPALPRGAAVEVQPLCMLPPTQAGRSHCPVPQRPPATLHAASTTACVHVPDRFFRAHGCCAAPGGEAGAVAAVQECLHAAALSWSDVTCARLYVADADDASTAARAWDAALELAHAPLHPLVLPVLGVASPPPSCDHMDAGDWLHSLLEVTVMRFSGPHAPADSE